jgi:hypothetical protein
LLSGRKPVAALERAAPVMPDLDTEPAVLTDVLILKVLHEISAASIVDVLPPGLHPTIPPLVTWMIWQVGDSPFGSFAMAQTRIECRSGARPRAYLVSAVADSAPAAQALASRWGFPKRVATVDLQRSYDRVGTTVTVDGRTALDLEAVDPVPLRPSDIQWISNMHPATTPRGLRLVQVDPAYEVTRAERARPILKAFDAAAWGEPGIVPTHPVAAAIATATITLPRIRFVCAPDQLAFLGTEKVGTAS